MKWFLRLLCVLGTLLLVACSRGMHPERALGPAVPENSSAHAVEVHQPESLGMLDTSPTGGVSCKTCHGSQSQGGLLTEQRPANFHRGLQLQHGNLSCNACHDSDRSRLHLADGTRLDFDQTAKLCAQCHGTQARDYEKGAHGGMSGYWDLRRGGRERNTCVDCHAAHSPAYERVRPVHPPKDRFVDWNAKESKSHE